MEMIRSTIEPYDSEAFSFEKLAEKIKTYTYVILYKYDRVEIKRASESLSLDNLLELRAFDRDKELHIVALDGEWRGRTRDDTAGDVSEILEEDHLLWGTETELKEDGYTFLSEDRGVALTLPIPVPAGQRAFVTVRNYLHPDRFEFSDWRMVDFFAKEVTEYGIK